MLDGLQNGPAAKTVTIGDCFCQSFVSNSFTSISAKEKAIV